MVTAQWLHPEDKGGINVINTTELTGGDVGLPRRVVVGVRLLLVSDC